MIFMHVYVHVVREVGIRDEINRTQFLHGHPSAQSISSY